MDMIGGSNKEMELPASADGLSRRNVDDGDRRRGRTGRRAARAGGHLSGGKLWRTAGGAARPRGRAHARATQRHEKGITDVVLGATKQPPDPAKRLFVQIFETAEGGFGVNGQVFVPRK